MRNADALQTIAKVTTLVAALWAAPLHAQVVSLSPNQVIALAADAIRDERPGDAVVAMDAYLRQIPDDPSALLIRTEAAILTGDFPGAVSFGQKAFWNAASDGQRYSASRLIALGHARQMQDSRAQLWLRAARQFAPNEAASESVARDFVAIRQRNPLSVSLRFGVTPSSNVNSGATNAEVDILGLPFVLNEDGLALSGWQYSGSADLRYRIRTDQSSATFFDIGIRGTTYTLSEESRERIENDPSSSIEDGSDLSEANLSFGLTHRFVLAPDAGLTTASISLSQSWRAGDPNRRYATTSLSHTWRLSDRDSITLSGFSQQQERLENGDKAQVWDISASYRTAFEGIGGLSFGIGLRDNIAEDDGEDYDSIRYNLGFTPTEPLFGVNFGFGLSYEERVFDYVPLILEGRTDEITSFNMRAVFSDVELFGFQPVVTFARTRQESTASLFDRDFTEFGFDIVSSF